MANNRRTRGNGQGATMKSDDWLTDPSIIKALGHFDLDPCTPEVMPWTTATRRYTKKENGLISPWEGRVWLNPPFSKQAEFWLLKMKDHQNGISLVAARTETKWFKATVWDHANSIFFFYHRLYFYTPAGIRNKINFGSPCVLVSYDESNSESIASSGLRGKHLPVNHIPVIIVGASSSWITVVEMAIKRVGDAEMKAIYDMVERLAGDKVQANKHWKEKVRQKIYAIRARMN